ncbi:hypothetical protein [Plantactinospora endophytica]|uniref:DUF3995 domain-containing protein n=1 Tax=Plantactinospora endophytica TaxID=673535 RepID=A0ABQ4DUL2_9ACTN|nr:hypothetical protein [Plantactinospora endophytica]GIG86154.1 hypothetical protein Pen02_10900 [Plantactinospora endophytica]
MTRRRHGIDVLSRRPGAPPAGPAPGGIAAAWAPSLVLLWALGYGGLRVHWALGGAPEFPPLGTDLFPFAGWGAVALVGAAAPLAVALVRVDRWWWPLTGAAWGVSVALMALCPLLLLDAVGLLIPGLGLSVDPVGFASRAGCLAGGVLLAVATDGYRRRCRGDRPLFGGRLAGTPRWARVAAYLAVAGCLVRLAAQYAVGMAEIPIATGPAVLAFEAGFLLAGLVLPLALVHGWGRVFPRWVPVLAGRRVPRWLLLGPGFGLGLGLVGYFGVGTGQLAVETATGSWDPGDGTYPLWFFWVSMPAYLVWGCGLTVAALAYWRRTRS